MQAVGLVLCTAAVVSAQVETPEARGNAVAAEALPDELRGLAVKDFFLPLEAETVGRIERLSGHVVVRRKNTRQAYFAAAGDPVYQNDVFFTLSGSRCRVKFKSADMVTMGEEAALSIDEVADDPAARSKRSVFGMLKGKALFYIVRLFRHRQVEASVKSPTAVMGVRGTKFGVEVVPGEGRAAMPRRILIASAGAGGLHLRAQTQPFGGGKGYTKLLVFEGKVFGVLPDGRLVEVTAGRTAMLSGLEHEVYGSSPGEVEQFLEDVGEEGLRGHEGGDQVTGQDTGPVYDDGGDGTGPDVRIDEQQILDRIQEDGFILDLEEEPITTGPLP